MNNDPLATPPVTSLRASACPGLLRIVAALDGGICRIKLPCGRLSVQQALTIADAARAYAADVIEVTNRANLQIRGVRSADAQRLIDVLLAAGLGPSAPGGDDVRNVMVSPCAGIDTVASFNVEPLAMQILDRLQTQTRFHQLSAKFALLLDGGERVAMLEHHHDLWLSAMPGHAALLAFGLAGCPPQANAQHGALAAVPVAHALELIEAILQLFLELARPEQTRMRHLFAEMPVALFLQQLQRRLSFALITDATVISWRRVAVSDYAYIGIWPQQQSQLSYIGAAPVLGRIDSLQLRGLAQLASQYDSTLRFTPWQSVLLANIPTAKAATVAHDIQQLGFSCDAAAALTRTIACTGSAGCAKGLADTKADALLLADNLQKNWMRKLPGNQGVPVVHLSGCKRSCAAAHSAPFTLLATAPGYYDVFQRAEDRSDFGNLIASDLTIEECGDLLIQRVMTATK